MHTGDGQFWIIVEREPFVKWPSALGFAFVDIGYMAILAKMFMFRSIAKWVECGRNTKSWYVIMAQRYQLQQVVEVWGDFGEQFHITMFSSKLAIWSFKV
ncbi:hypothetical protein DVH05_004189 [Phytophthora capsici]|nr:hypothetical protein DVH05_004189 [Phytophthora capsici]